ncbi:MAG: energy transducer TonB [Reichenbachiella sp.]
MTKINSVRYSVVILLLLALNTDVIGSNVRMQQYDKDSLIKVWEQMQRKTYFSGQYEKSVLYFDSLLDQQGIRINYVCLRLGMYSVNKSGLERDFDFGYRVYGQSLMNEEWHPISISANERPYYQATKPPTPVGGMKRFEKYIKKNLAYPKEAQKYGIQGEVEVQFVINKDGSLGGVCILKGISLDCNLEAERLIRNGPKWKPAEHHDKLVYYRMVFPIEFKIPTAP